MQGYPKFDIRNCGNSNRKIGRPLDATICSKRNKTRNPASSGARRFGEGPFYATPNAVTMRCMENAPRKSYAGE